MKNADEYIDKLFLQRTLMVDFLKEHPEITRLEQRKRLEVIGKLLGD